MVMGYGGYGPMGGVSYPLGGDMYGMGYNPYGMYQAPQMPEISGGYQWATMDERAAVAREDQRRYEAALRERQPYIESGHKALGKLNELVFGKEGGGSTSAYDALMASPRVQFAMEQGSRAQNRMSNAQHRSMSGRAFKEMQRYAQGLGSQLYGEVTDDYYKAAHSPSPFGWHPSGGASDYPTLDDYEDSNSSGHNAGGGGVFSGGHNAGGGGVSSEGDNPFPPDSPWDTNNADSEEAIGVNKPDATNPYNPLQTYGPFNQLTPNTDQFGFGSPAGEA